jgi:hypothetical protein
VSRCCSEEADAETAAGDYGKELTEQDLARILPDIFYYLSLNSRIICSLPLTTGRLGRSLSPAMVQGVYADRVRRPRHSESRFLQLRAPLSLAMATLGR